MLAHVTTYLAKKVLKVPLIHDMGVDIWLDQLWAYVMQCKSESTNSTYLLLLFHPLLGFFFQTMDESEIVNIIKPGCSWSSQPC